MRIKGKNSGLKKRWERNRNMFGMRTREEKKREVKRSLQEMRIKKGGKKV